MIRLALTAALPIGAILALMLGLRWSAARAGAAALALTLVLVRWPFDYGSATYGELGYWRAVAGAVSEAGFTTFTILWIIFPALCIYHLQVLTGRMDSIRASVTSVSDDLRIGILFIVCFFALFIEGAAGFGAPVALGAPLLVAAGVTPHYAVAAVLIGHSVGVSFGAVGTPVVAQAALTGLAPDALARATGPYHALAGWVMLLIAAHGAVRGLEATGTGRRLLPWTLTASALFLFPMFAISRWVGPELPTLGGSLIGGVCFVLIARLRSGPGAATRRGSKLGLLTAGAPYAALIVLVLATRLIEPVRHVTTSVILEWRALEAFSGRMEPLHHPGTMLLAGFLLGAAVQGAGAAEVRRAASAAAWQLRIVVPALLAMLGISRLMVHSGMIEALAQSGAVLRTLWPLCSPFAGVLGTFVTGSATASNILMSDLQRTTAASLSLPPVVLLGAQGFGAAVGNMVAPHNIIAGCATVGLTGREGDVLRRTLWPCLLYASLGGMLAMVFVRLAIRLSSAS